MDTKLLVRVDHEQEENVETNQFETIEVIDIIAWNEKEYVIYYYFLNKEKRIGASEFIENGRKITLGEIKEKEALNHVRNWISQNLYNQI